MIEDGVVGGSVLVCPLLGGRAMNAERPVGGAGQGDMLGGEERTVRADHDTSGRFGNLKPRLLRQRQPGTADHDQAEDATDDTYKMVRSMATNRQFTELSDGYREVFGSSDKHAWLIGILRLGLNGHKRKRGNH